MNTQKEFAFFFFAFEINFTTCKLQAKIIAAFMPCPYILTN